MALYNDIIQGAVQNISTNGPASTVGDALGAYKMATDLQNGQAELKMKQEKNEQDKANWVVGSLVNIAKLGGKAQGIAIDTFGKRMQQAYPGYNQDFVKLFKEDEDFRRNVASQSASLITRGAIQTPEQAKMVYDYLHMSNEDVVQQFDKMGQEQAKVQAAQLSAQALGQRAQNMQDNSTLAATKAFDTNSKLPNLMDLGRKLDRDTEMLAVRDPKHPVTYTAVHEVLQNIATVLGNGAISDARVKSISPHLGDEVSAKIQTFLNNDPNQPADPDLVEYTKHLVGRLNRAVDGDVIAQAKVIGAGKDADLFNNKNIAVANKRKEDYFTTRKWRTDYSQVGGGEAPPPVSYGMTPKEIEENYQQYLAQKAHEAANGRR